MIILSIFVVVVVVGVIVFETFITEEFLGKEEKSTFNYERRDFLMSRPEHEFFDILVGAIGVQYHVFPQIHLDDILEHKVKGQNWKGAFRHIDEKSVDFVICDKAYIRPLLAIELDDKTHERDDRKKRDVEVERILNGAELPLLRFGNNGYFDKEEIKRLVLEKLK